MPEDSLRVQAYGRVDELNSILGLARSLDDKELDTILEGLQQDLFVAGADFASAERAEKIPQNHEGENCRIGKNDRHLQEALPPLKVFILPGGGQAGSILHFSRLLRGVPNEA